MQMDAGQGSDGKARPAPPQAQPDGTQHPHPRLGSLLGFRRLASVATRGFPDRTFETLISVPITTYNHE
jgi:hypothetical protein